MTDTKYAARERAQFEKRQAQRGIPIISAACDLSRRICGGSNDGFLRVATTAGFKKKKGRKRK